MQHDDAPAAVESCKLGRLSYLDHRISMDEAVAVPWAAEPESYNFVITK